MRSRVGETALHFAAREGHAEATRSLIKHGADISAVTKSGATPADYARRHKEREWKAVLELLGASPQPGAIFLHE